MKAALLREWQPADILQSYSSRDSILYALGIGLGSDPLDRRALPFVFEKDQQAFPCMAAVLASPGFWMRDHPEFGIDHRRIVHGEQHLRLYRPLPASGTVRGRTRSMRVIDKGAGKPAVIHASRSLFMDDEDDKIADIEHVYVYRGGGGFAVDGEVSDDAAASPAPTPTDDPDFTVSVATRPEAALLYRLSGDYNPLHADPAVAAQAGFDRPILHGLATWAIAARALIWKVADGDVTRLRSYSARMSSPAYPGDRFEVRGWHDGNGRIGFDMRVPDREVVVLAGGIMSLSS